jgi:hypothetical protein
LETVDVLIVNGTRIYSRQTVSQSEAAKLIRDYNLTAATKGLPARMIYERDYNKSFALGEVIDKQILPLINEVVDICIQNKIPMIATFLYSRDGTNSGLVTNRTVNPGDGRWPALYTEIVNMLSPERIYKNKAHKDLRGKLREKRWQGE